MASNPLRSVRSVLETPILDQHKWAKVPSIPADAVLLDLEDSVPQARKTEARAHVVDSLARVNYFDGRLPLPRMNALATPEGSDDVVALAQAGASIVVYPKLRTADELADVQHELRAAGGEPSLVPVIETAQAIIDLDRIAQIPNIAGFFLGPYDLAVDAGFTPFYEGRTFSDAYHYAKSKLILVGAAYDIPVYDMALIPELHDLATIRAQAEYAHRMGFAGMTAFYPPHIDIVNDVFTPSHDQIDHARQVVAAYEQALDNGLAAVQLNGKALIVQDYKQARRTLDKARE